MSRHVLPTAPSPTTTHLRTREPPELVRTSCLFRRIHLSGKSDGRFGMFLMWAGIESIEVDFVAGVLTAQSRTIGIGDVVMGKL